MTGICGAIILAAGHSRRMGSNKLLALYRGKPLVAHVADAAAAAGLPAIVVLGHAEREIRTALADHDVRFVFARHHAQGMGHSIAAGIRAVPPEWHAAIICLGDMPLVPAALLRQMADAADDSAILVPTFERQRGNPALWGRAYFPELETLRGDQGARALFTAHGPSVRHVAWTDNTILQDFDTPESLKILNHENPQ